MAIDNKDIKLLNLLLDNSRLSYRQLAKKTGFSITTVMNRIRKLEEEGIIKAYGAELNYEKIGYDIAVLINIRISKGKLLEVEKKIAAHPNVYAVYDHTGPFDALIIAKFRSRKSMDKFLKKIQSYGFVERTETSLILNTLKDKNIRV